MMIYKFLVVKYKLVNPFLCEQKVFFHFCCTWDCQMGVLEINGGCEDTPILTLSLHRLVMNLWKKLYIFLIVRLQEHWMPESSIYMTREGVNCLNNKSLVRKWAIIKQMPSWDLLCHHLLGYFCCSELFGGKVRNREIYLYRLLVRKGKIMIMMKMFDEKFKLTHVWVYKIFQKYILGCFFFLKRLFIHWLSATHDAAYQEQANKLINGIWIDKAGRDLQYAVLWVPR